MFYDKFKIYNIVYMPGFYCDDPIKPEQGGWYADRGVAETELKKQSTWKPGAIVEHEVDAATLVRVLNLMSGLK